MRAERVNARYLPGVPIPDDIEIGSDIDALLDGADRVLSVVPTQHVRAV